MNKTLFLWLFVTFLVSSCSFKKDKLTDDSTAAINTIAVIIDDQLWNSEVGDSIRNKLASPVLGLPQEEPLFTINQYPVKLFEGFSTDTRNIIIVKKENETKFEIKENEFALPQNTIHISGKTVAEILEILEENAPRIIQKMRAVEIAQNQKIFRDSLLNTQKIQKKFNIDILVPSKYEYVMRRKNFIWLKSEITSGNTSLIIYQVPYSAIHNGSAVSDIVRTRDSIGRKFIHGSVYGTKMVTEEAYSPYFSKTMLAGRKAFETKGTWQMKNDFMSGPFINYAIFDKANKRILVLEGFCYAPSKEKRDLMFELESMIKSIQFKK
ncbi:DUF4837 family protein [Flavobacterium sedimenticola]|uniref:DUF4837 family protein n=1 Tax=Flavobacterium sedimenticola TaxID=3043286 RepID=A0ABT6XN10_9FLAO|nr:DUF4837 family protein [Flavobacterium sedimenticola]MDI9256069.1 DUF4837 family protein [Flavobacterium sedimenticola]